MTTEARSWQPPPYTCSPCGDTGTIQHPARLKPGMAKLSASEAGRRTWDELRSRYESGPVYACPFCNTGQLIHLRLRWPYYPRPENDSQGG